LNYLKLRLFLAAAFMVPLLLLQQALAASPVRLAITAATNSGIEQEVGDQISRRFNDDPDVELSTVNPDWFVLCTIKDLQDRVGGQIRYNGTVTVKTHDGQIISTISMQQYNQDFSLEQGAPLNKQLVMSAANDVINGMAQRASSKIKEAVQVEIATRDTMATAEALADQDKYDEAIAELKKLSLDTVHYRESLKRIDQFVMEKHALESIQAAEVKSTSKHYSEAITLLKEVSPESKRHKTAVQLTQRYKALLAEMQRQAELKRRAKMKSKK
jgi:hypothetical protein